MPVPHKGQRKSGKDILVRAIAEIWNVADECVLSLAEGVLAGDLNCSRHVDTQRDRVTDSLMESLVERLRREQC